MADGRGKKGSPMRESGDQHLVRRVNDSIYDVSKKLGAEDGDFWCECNMLCRERIRLTLREYAAGRQGEHSALLARSHVSMSLT
jgi:hypothetical protein